MAILPKFSKHLKKIIYYLFFLVYGFFALLAQTILVRELLIAFYGNELFSGIFLGIWFLGTGLGSLININVFNKIKFKNLFLLLITLLILFPLQLIFIRFFTGKLYPTDANASPISSLVFSFLTIFPFCFLMGTLFKLGCNYFIIKIKSKSPDAIVSKAYLLEIVGLILAGLIFNFFLINTSFPFSNVFNLKTYKFRFPNLNLVKNTKYSQIAITKSGDQINFYQNGKFIFSNQEQEQNEYLIHFIVSHHKNPQQILFIGNGLSGSLLELTKYPKVVKIDYLQLDNTLINLAKNNLSANLTSIFSNPKINIIHKDPRLFLNTSNKNYDLIISNLPNPTTALFNRFYTQQYYQKINSVQKTNGLFATFLSLPTDYLSLEARNLFLQIYHTLNTVFPNIKVYPDENNILFLSSKNSVTNNLNDLEENFNANNIETSFFSNQYLKDRLLSLKIKQFEGILKSNNIKKTNSDIFPNAYFLQTSFWQTMYSFQSAKLFNFINTINYGLIILFLLIILSFVFLRANNNSSIQFITVFTAGVNLMAMEIILLFYYQSIIGLVFSKIALIFALALIGVAAGNLISSYYCLKFKLKYLKILEKIVFIILILYLLIFSYYINKLQNEYIFYLYLFIIGFITGQAFPFANKILFSKISKKTLNSGYLYSADIFGALTGSLLTSIFSLPLFGIIKTVYLLIIVNIFSLILLQKKLEQ